MVQSWVVISISQFDNCQIKMPYSCALIRLRVSCVMPIARIFNNIFLNPTYGRAGTEAQRYTKGYVFCWHNYQTI